MSVHQTAESSKEQQNNGTDFKDDGSEEEEQKPSKTKRIWSKTGLDLPTLLMMIKAALPPTIAIAFFQAKPVAQQYSTLGYLVAISSILGFAIMPRAKFFQTMFINLITICLGTCIALLGIWTVVQARKHTTSPGEPLSGYNPSASTVSAIWLFFQLYLINALRSALPQLQFPAILYAIFGNIAFVNAPLFGTMDQGISFATRLITTFLTGFGLATGVSLLFIPVNARKPVFGEVTGALKGMDNLMKTLVAYMQAFEHDGAFETKQAAAAEDTPTRRKLFSKRGEHKYRSKFTSIGADSKALKGAVEGLVQVLGKLYGDLPFAKREIAYGKLRPSDLTKLHQLLRLSALPLVGLSSIVDIFERLSKLHGWDQLASSDDSDNTEKDITNHHDSRRTFQDWQQVMSTLHIPFAEITSSMKDAIQHILYQLELQKRPKDSSDVEKASASRKLGESNFADRFTERIDAFYDSKQVTLHQWCEQRGIQVPAGSFETAFEWSQIYENAEAGTVERHQRQLLTVLFMEYLLHAGAKALLDVVHFADEKVRDGTMKKRRLIVPPYRTLKKWSKTLLSSHEDTSSDDHHIMAESGAAYKVSVGAAFGARKDPEHLPPENALQRIGNALRKVPEALRSSHSAFGFRAACATMSVAIVAYLRESYVFFIEQRLVWAMIMIAFSMMRTSGQSAFNFVLRIFGTFVAMVASFIVWYIVNGRKAGVIVFLFIWIAACFYIVIKKPAYVVIGIISAITVVLIVGFELQVDAIGRKASAATGQPYYPIYELAPYRLATVVGGLAIAYFWTVFPYSVTEHTELRHSVGSALYLSANFYSVIHETVKARTRGEANLLPDAKDSPYHRLEKMSSSLISKSHLIITAMRNSSSYSRWQLSIGGRFPKETYDGIIDEIERIVRCTALIGYASRTFQADSSSSAPEESEWTRDFKILASSIDTTSHDVTSRLALLSSSLTNGQPLPPYLQPLQPFQLLKKLQTVDRDILSVRHLAEPGYAAFAVMQIASRVIIADLNELTDRVKSLVGELDFSFRVDTVEEEKAKGGKVE